MPRLINHNPKYRKHKPSGRAVVTLNGEDIYLGAYGAKPSREKYDKLIGEWLSRGRQTPGDGVDHRVADVIQGYWTYAQDYYGVEGRSELESIKAGLSILRKLYGTSPARTFGPLALQVVREGMVKAGWSRNYINAQTGRIKRCFKWASSRELIPAATFHGLQAVDGLRRGKTDARECEPVGPVPEAWVNETLKHTSRQVGGMIRLQMATGMRPGEACVMRGCDIDTAGKVWEYRPEQHKGQHRGHERVIFMGPRAQAVVGEFLKRDMQAYLFSPTAAEQERRAAMSEARKTPLSCGSTPGSNKKRKPGRKPDEKYDTAAYRRAIARGCDEAFPPPAELQRIRVVANGRKVNATRWETPQEWQNRLGKNWEKLETWQTDHRWHPHQLRHSAATLLRKEFGLEAARVVLGHRSAAVAEIYAEIDLNRAREIMGKVG